MGGVGTPVSRAVPGPHSQEDSPLVLGQEARDPGPVDRHVLFTESNDAVGLRQWVPPGVRGHGGNTGIQTLSMYHHTVQRPPRSLDDGGQERNVLLHQHLMADAGLRGNHTQWMGSKPAHRQWYLCTGTWYRVVHHGDQLASIDLLDEGAQDGTRLCILLDLYVGLCSKHLLMCLGLGDRPCLTGVCSTSTYLYRCRVMFSDRCLCTDMEQWRMESLQTGPLPASSGNHCWMAPGDALCGRRYS